MRTGFAAILRQERRAAGVSAAAAARRAGMSPQSWHVLESGRTADPKWSTVQRVAEALKISTDRLRTDGVSYPLIIARRRAYRDFSK